MESEIIQQGIKTRKRELSPEKELLRRFGKLPKVKLDDLNSKSKEELLKWIDQHFRSKEILLGFIKSLYTVIQQMYFEASQNLDPNSSTLEFQILEGSVILDFTKDPDEQYRFKPNKTLEDLIKDSDNKCTTKLKDFLDSRFYKMIEALYKLYN
jgi:hypothetical protein